MDRVLVTGAAGFIGFHLARRLLQEGHDVVGVDNFNPYYAVSLKQARAAELARIHDGFVVHNVELADARATDALLSSFRPDVVVHLAAQAGVRYSLENPESYIQSNLVAFANLLESCRRYHPRHLVYASSSSVYGSNRKTPFSVADAVDHPISLYAATKKANELMAHTYSHLYGLPTTGLRFFTVYGPWGRPDMATWKFTEAIFQGSPIDVYNFGNMRRDFTYIDDVVEGVMRVMAKPPEPNPSWDAANPDPGTSSAPYRLYNIGNNAPTELLRFIELLEEAIGKKAERRLLPLQPGDVLETFAEIDDLTRDVGFRPSTRLEEGLPRFVEWYRSYVGV